ncbi:haloacid dehalogenase-like hydrolase [Nocardiopsis potens]|uniref:haloacid dehalogenase-like hydrolase n=1 Tax=Nocardiopsis potens TaxID=1246458 RepID=UPI0003768763|nr:haloacid dehalogenase-like hydrolase [Nocardiopsis potens]
MRIPARIGAAALAAAVACTGPGAAAAEAGRAADGRCPTLSEDLEWYGGNRAELQRVIDELGVCGEDGGGGGRGGDRPVAAFDWDDTVTKNDVTDATLVWALQHDEILRPADWSGVSPWLTPAADRALTEACGTEVPVDEPLPTSTEAGCADEILSIRGEARTMSGERAFEGRWNHRRTVPEYAWVPQLFAGRTPEEVREIARKARRRALAAPVGAVQRVGTHTVPGYVRYYPQQRDLIRTLRRAGFDVHIVSAGFEPIAEVWAAGVGVPPSRTIAIRSVLDGGRITTRNEGCGGTEGGRGEVIPYIEGKRCWVNQEIFGVDGPDAWERQDAGRRIALGSGDSDTDVSFVSDATHARLVVNRNQDEIMCRAYDDADGAWLVNPMFIDPLPQRTDPYPCSTTGYTRPNGGTAPVLRDDGTAIPDQQDTAH